MNGYYDDNLQNDASTLKIVSDDHDRNLSEHQSRIIDLEMKIDGMWNEFQEYKTHSQMLTELVLSTFDYNTFSNIIEGVRNSIYTYDNYSPYTKSVRYVYNVIVCVSKDSMRHLNMANIIDWSIVILNECGEDYNLLETIRDFLKSNNSYLSFNHVRDLEVSRIINNTLTIEEIAEHVSQTNELSNYLVSRIDFNTLSTLSAYIFEQCSFEVIKKLWNVFPNKEVNKNIFHDLLYNVVTDNNNRHNEFLNKDQPFIKKIRSSSRKIDNYYKILNQD